MRHQFISSLARAGVHPKEQHLARHSTITLTLNQYTHLHTADIAAVVEKLPPPVAAGEEIQECRQTDTDGASLVTHLATQPTRRLCHPMTVLVSGDSSPLGRPSPSRSATPSSRSSSLSGQSGRSSRISLSLVSALVGYTQVQATKRYAHVADCPPAPNSGSLRRHSRAGRTRQ